MTSRVLRAVLATLALLALIPTVMPRVAAQPTAARRGGKILRNDGARIVTQSFDTRVTLARRPSLHKQKARTVPLKALGALSPDGAESVIGEDERVQVLDTAQYPNS